MSSGIGGFGGTRPGARATHASRRDLGLRPRRPLPGRSRPVAARGRGDERGRSGPRRGTPGVPETESVGRHDAVVLAGGRRPPITPGEEQPHPGSRSQYAHDSRDHSPGSEPPSRCGWRDPTGSMMCPEPAGARRFAPAEIVGLEAASGSTSDSCAWRQVGLGRDSVDSRDR